MAKKLSKKKREFLIEVAYGRFCSGIQVPVLKLGRIFKYGEDTLDAMLQTEVNPESLAGMVILGEALKEAALQCSLDGGIK